jgi:hypothetical protein
LVPLIKIARTIQTCFRGAATDGRSAVRCCEGNQRGNC